MASSSRLVFIGAGVATSVSSTLVIYDSGQAGVLGAQRILTHPDADNFAAINYYRNPDTTFNLDNEVLPSPIAEPVRTLTSRKVVRFEETLQDVVVTEIWEGRRNSRAAMPTFLFRQLYEYLRNPPAFDASNQTFITWAPRDRTAKVYNVELFGLKVGSGSKDQVLEVDDFRLPTPPEVKNPLQSLDVSPTGLITNTVEVRMRVVSEVV